MDEINKITIKISMDKLQAFINIPAEALPLSKESIDSLLQEHKISFGIKNEIVEQLQSGSVSAGEYLIAQGVIPENGQNSQNIFHFNTIPFIEREPLKREDDSFDYYNKGIVDYVNENDIIAEITPPTFGINGKNVLGEIIPAKKGILTTIHFDKTIAYSEHDYKYIALQTGHPILKDNRLSILTDFEVKDVDLSTGNIYYSGDIIVHENVRSGFDLKTKKNIKILGAIHHSNIYAGGNILCEGGKIPGEEGSLVAGGDITIPFVDGGEIKAGGNLIIKNHLINTQASVKNDVLCDETEGLILGGKITAGNLIQTFDLGSHNETKTEIILDNLSERLARLKEIESIKKDQTKELNDGLPTFQRLEKLIKNNHFIDSMNKEQMDRILNTYAHLVNQRKKLQQESALLNKERQEILESIKFGKSPELHVYGTVHAKVHITINNAHTLIRNALTNIKFSVFNDEIQIHSIKSTTI